jgi:hypothetical protein
MLNSFMAIISFEIFIYVQRKKGNRIIASSEELMAAKRKQNFIIVYGGKSKTLYE